MRPQSISVVIPAYNAAHYLRETLESVLAQTLPADEILVIDDGSTDETAEVGASFGSAVRVISQPNAKLGATRNRGVQEATGEWIAFIDADDIWKPNKLQLQMEELAKYPEADICYTGRIDFMQDENGIEFDTPMLAPPADKIREFLFRKSTFLPSSAIIRRSVLLESGGFATDPDVAEDWDLWIRLLHAGKKFAGCTEPLVLYRIHLTGITADGRRLLRSNTRVYRQYIMPHVPASIRAIRFSRFLSENEAGAAFAMRRTGDTSCIPMMALSILHWPFTDIHRFKVLMHMLLSWCTGKLRPNLSRPGRA
jgi:glycosyltransferase involved in cell wall biosynthesis